MFSLFDKTSKEEMIESETGILLNWIFIFGVYDYCGRKYFSEPVDISVLTGQGIRGISGIIFRNCESSVSSIGDLRVTFCEFEGPPCVSLDSRYVQLSLLRAGEITHYSASGFNRHVLQLAAERKRRHSLNRGMSKELRSSFFSASGSPSFQACADCSSCRVPASLRNWYF